MIWEEKEALSTLMTVNMVAIGLSQSIGVKSYHQRRRKLSRLTKTFSDGEYFIEPNLINYAIRKLGKIEDRIEKEEKNYIEANFEIVMEEGALA